MTGALLCMGNAVILAQAIHRRALAGRPVAPVAIDHTVRMVAAGVAFFVAARVGL